MRCCRLARALPKRRWAKRVADHGRAWDAVPLPCGLHAGCPHLGLLPSRSRVQSGAWGLLSSLCAPAPPPPKAGIPAPPMLCSRGSGALLSIARAPRQGVQPVCARNTPVEGQPMLPRAQAGARVGTGALPRAGCSDSCCWAPTCCGGLLDGACQWVFWGANACRRAAGQRAADIGVPAETARPNWLMGCAAAGRAASSGLLTNPSAAHNSPCPGCWWQGSWSLLSSKSPRPAAVDGAMAGRCPLPAHAPARHAAGSCSSRGRTIGRSCSACPIALFGRRQAVHVMQVSARRVPTLCR